METHRYMLAKPLLKKPTIFECIFSKYGTDPITGARTTCLVFLCSELEPSIIIDHVWVSSISLVKANLRTGQKLLIKGRLNTRKRAPENLFEEQIKDIQLEKVDFLAKHHKRTKIA